MTGQKNYREVVMLFTYNDPKAHSLTQKQWCIHCDLGAGSTWHTIIRMYLLAQKSLELSLHVFHNFLIT